MKLKVVLLLGCVGGSLMAIDKQTPPPVPLKPQVKALYNLAESLQVLNETIAPKAA